jgi:hypothetical protein
MAYILSKKLIDLKKITKHIMPAMVNMDAISIVISFWRK